MCAAGRRQDLRAEGAAVIRINDRQDPTQPSTPLADAETVDSTGLKRTFLAPGGSEFASRLNQAGAAAPRRFNVAIGDPDEAPEGIAPDVWYGVVESWVPQGSNILVTCRAARTVEEGIH